ncbi:MAG: zinc ribbon domain-containing protein [Betaproteobacteria bacterium]|nr:zinc ribbon domain-containing protein [Betaproteobacteria bacterium]
MGTELGGEALAQDKFACPACGGDAHWNPARQALVCPFCGTSAPVAGDPTQLGAMEHDLVTALRGVPDEARGWQADKASVKCQSCQAISVLDRAHQAQRCDFCGSAQIVPYEQTKAAFRPESLLPFKVGEGQAREAIRAWYGKVWFAPNALKKRALTDTVHGIYLPYWTFDAKVDAQWRAEAGYHHYTTETGTNSAGETRTRRVQHTRWEAVQGRLSHFFDDDLVCASVGVNGDLLRGVEPFPTKQGLVPYDPKFVAGWVVERYQIDLIAAAQRAREAMEVKTRELCRAQVPGDTCRNLEVDARYSAQTFKHILVPAWLVTYQYGSKTYQVVQNGATGKIAGHYPKSWIKIMLAVLAGLAIVLFIVSIDGRA